MGAKPRVQADTSNRRVPEVDRWLDERGHPQAELMSKVREVILAADERIDECIKWSCPTFTYEGNIVSFNPAAKSHVSLMFHTGGKIPAKLPQLTGSGNTCKYMRIDDVADLRLQKAKLIEVVVAWCDWKQPD